MTEFEQAYQSWVQASFPPDGASEEFADLHADLALVDSWVAESLVPFVKHGKYVPAKVDVLKKLAEIRDRATALLSSESIEIDELAKSYEDYANLLKGAYESFLQLRPK